MVAERSAACSNMRRWRRQNAQTPLHVVTKNTIANLQKYASTLMDVYQ